MAKSEEAFEFRFQETPNDLSQNGKHIDIKAEQEAASLVRGHDVLVIH